MWNRLTRILPLHYLITLVLLITLEPPTGTTVSPPQPQQ
jgi:peptidoglycan/LPS O-acetylase OafA/YrhL